MKKWRFHPLSPEGTVVAKPKTKGTAVNDSARNSTALRAPVVSVQIPLPLLESLHAAQGDLFALFVDTGREVLRAMMEQDRVALKALGVRLRPDATRCPDGQLARHKGAGQANDYAEYVLPTGRIGQGLPPTEHVMYAKGVEVEAEPGSEVLAQVIASYFDRTWERFCSHRQTPSSGRPDYPAIVRRGRVIYFAHPIFGLYHARAPRWCKRLLLNAIDTLLPERLLRHDGPSTVMATVNEQAAERRWVVHLLHYIPERRGADFDVIEDVIPVYDVKLSVKVPGKVRDVVLVPEQSPLKFKQKDDRIEFTVKELVGHQMIEIV